MFFSKPFLLRLTKSLLQAKENGGGSSFGFPLLLSKSYHQVEAGAQRDGLVVKNFGFKLIEFRVDGIKIKKDSERFNEFFELRKCYSIIDDASNNNVNEYTNEYFVIFFKVPARYELVFYSPNRKTTTTYYVDELISSRKVIIDAI